MLGVPLVRLANAMKSAKKTAPPKAASRTDAVPGM
jgi:hypothetical protein